MGFDNAWLIDHFAPAFHPDGPWLESWTTLAALAARKRKAKEPEVEPKLSRHMITAHVMSLMQRGFTRLIHAGRQIDLASPDDYQRDDFDDVYVLVDGDVYALHVGTSDPQAGGAVASAMVAITPKGCEVLVRSPKA